MFVGIESLLYSCTFCVGCKFNVNGNLCNILSASMFKMLCS